MGLLLLDLDGTLVADALYRDEANRMRRRQTERYDEPELLPGRSQTLLQAAEEGDRFAIVTNQGGVAWGYHTEAEVYGRIAATVRQLEFFWGQPFSVHVAFQHPSSRSLPDYRGGEERRKPAPTMIEEAMLAHYEESERWPEHAPVLFVGNNEDDSLAAHAADVEYVEADDFFS